MSDLIERVARRAKPGLWRGFDDNPDSSWTEKHRHQELVFTERAVREVLAALREPSATVLEAARPINPYPASTWRLMLDAFAREHGLEEPPP